MRVSYQSRVLNRSQAAGNSAEADRPLVILVDDDDRLREALHELMLSVGLDAISFASTRDLLEAELPDRPSCLVVDVRMPGVSGLDLQHRLAESGDAKPIVFLTAHGDIPMSVQAMKAGAVDFLTKPVRDQTLLDAIAAGIERDIRQRAHARVVKEHLSKLALLTPRECQVLREVALGRLNKQIAFNLGISEITVKLHRGNVMRKMRLTSVGELVRVWEVLPAGVRERVEGLGSPVGWFVGSGQTVPLRRRLTTMAKPPGSGRDCDARPGEAGVARRRDQAEQIGRSRRRGSTPPAVMNATLLWIVKLSVGRRRRTQAGGYCAGNGREPHVDLARYERLISAHPATPRIAAGYLNRRMSAIVPHEDTLEDSLAT